MRMQVARFVCSLALLAGALVYSVGTAGAQGSDAARQACTPDALRLCSDYIPDVDKVAGCMRAKKAQLSEPCRVAMNAGGGSGGGRQTGHGHHRTRHCGKHSHHCG
jgi:hypothetical protein